MTKNKTSILSDPSSTDEKAIAVIEREAQPILKKAHDIIISSPEQMESAAEMLSRLNQLNDQLTTLKETVTKPLNAAIKAARELFKPRETKLEEAITLIRKEMGRYQLAEDRKAKEAEAKLAARVDKGTMKAETAVKKMDAIEKPEKNIETNSGSVTFRDDKFFEVINISELPIEYHLSNDVAIRKAMKSGTELPGVKYWMEKIVVNSR